MGKINTFQGWEHGSSGLSACYVSMTFEPPEPTYKLDPIVAISSHSNPTMRWETETETYGTDILGYATGKGQTANITLPFGFYMCTSRTRVSRETLAHAPWPHVAPECWMI